MAEIIVRRGSPRTTAQNGLGRLGQERERVPVMLPRLASLETSSDLEIEEARAAQALVAERRTIRAGIDAWHAINKAESFDGWLAIGRALLIGRQRALRETGADGPHGQFYSKAFCRWVRETGFASMEKSTRSVALELAENAEAITVWRNSLPERQRKRLIHPLSVTRRWRASLDHGNGKRRDAMAAWRRFVCCVQSLPESEAIPLWQTARVQAAEFLARCPQLKKGANYVPSAKRGVVNSVPL